jgi:chromosome segregation ATPase
MLDKIEREPSSSLAEQKLAAEIEKLRIENAQIRRPTWKSPTFLVTLLGLAASLIANVNQFQNSKKQLDNADNQFRLERDKWDTERKRLNAEIEKLHKQESRRDEGYEKVQNELRNIEKEINTWEESKFNDEVQLRLEKAKVDQYPTIEEYRKIVESRETSIKETEGRLSNLRARRTELEQSIGCMQ